MSKTLGGTPVETHSTPQDAAAGPERSPRRVIDPDGTVWTEVLDGETTRSPRRAPGPTPGGTFRPVADGQHTPGCAGYHGKLVPCDEARSPELLDGRIKEAVHMTADPINLTGPLETSCRYAPPIECNAVRVTWSPIVTIDPTQVTCAQCSKRLEDKPLAAGGYVSGPQPVLVGEKDGPFLSLADHAELARGKTPKHMLDRGLEEAIDTAYADGSIFSESSRDPADVHSDDAMLSAVQAQEDVLTPVAEEIRAVLNRYSAEAPSGTPDYILANYLIDCLKAFNEAVSLRAVWRGEPIEQMVLHIDKER
ncbi:MAG: hypothetical protein E6R04_05375 [Spirochaetes bacterium]|nr:MAG: hypothetical protein E6R04_05375 [Spirochaetota bacterium]